MTFDYDAKWHLWILLRKKKKVTDAGIKFLMPEGIVYFISTNMPDWVKSVSTI